MHIFVNMKGVSLLDFPIINQSRADTVDQWQSTCEALGSISTVPEEQRWKAWVWGVCRRKCESLDPLGSDPDICKACLKGQWIYICSFPLLSPLNVPESEFEETLAAFCSQWSHLLLRWRQFCPQGCVTMSRDISVYHNCLGVRLSSSWWKIGALSNIEQDWG